MDKKRWKIWRGHSYFGDLERGNRLVFMMKAVHSKDQSILVYRCSSFMLVNFADWLALLEAAVAISLLSFSFFGWCIGIVYLPFASKSLF